MTYGICSLYMIVYISGADKLHMKDNHFNTTISLQLNECFVVRVNVLLCAKYNCNSPKSPKSGILRIVLRLA